MHRRHRATDCREPFLQAVARWGDIDSDGDLDILLVPVSNYWETGDATAVIRNQGVGSSPRFVKDTSNLLQSENPEGRSDAQFGDFNGDGHRAAMDGRTHTRLCKHSQHHCATSCGCDYARACGS